MKTIRTTTCPTRSSTPNPRPRRLAAAAACPGLQCYDQVAKVVTQEGSVEKTQAALAITMGELNKKKASLKVVQDDLAALQANLASREEKEGLVGPGRLCGKKLVG